MTATFDGFFDDAAIFPPGNAPVDVAVKQHRARSEGPVGVLLGPLVCDTARLPALLAAATAPVRLSLVGAVHEVGPALAATGGTPVEPVAIEVLGPVAALPDVAVRTPAVEMPWGSGFEVPAGAVLKLRCGGAYVPTAAELAAAIAHCVAHDQPFKLTAGLHAAVAHDGAHGFVNVMAAVVAAMRGDDPEPVLTAASADLDLTTLSDSRRLFRSIGTCDLDEPLAGLRGLGLIA
ncbi:hypothetical protein H9L21_09415 [Aeromicrobium senzhongii]|uniref:Uncharacterized protein n=1 Tax=Aeromicrobium senzhongii TaxID=2663859 RepID=A0ABX6SQI3_9ACTN|nr:hypothetical protein [Aeromicrobium senzhongii]MTB86813.1 hypothetical protein [Aeromicrobium senzhongii]QNL93347.1 hypothetical protein H9L21_09415 [Aeromicrobium senzhongii]